MYNETPLNMNASYRYVRDLLWSYDSLDEGATTNAVTLELDLQNYSVLEIVIKQAKRDVKYHNLVIIDSNFPYEQMVGWNSYAGAIYRTVKVIDNGLEFGDTLHQGSTVKLGSIYIYRIYGIR